eukprot:4015683-Amphidinium_carterae.1
MGLSVGGVAAGATQVVRGLVNTPAAFRESQHGRRWDAECGAWVDDATNLREEKIMAAQWDSE